MSFPLLLRIFTRSAKKWMWEGLAAMANPPPGKVG